MKWKRKNANTNEEIGKLKCKRETRNRKLNFIVDSKIESTIQSQNKPKKKKTESKSKAKSTQNAQKSKEQKKFFQ